jgi:hypothetical protein
MFVLDNGMNIERTVNKCRSYLFDKLFVMLLFYLLLLWWWLNVARKTEKMMLAKRSIVTIESNEC